MPKVLVPIAEGFEEIEAICIIDILRRGGIEVIMGSLDARLSVKGAHGVIMQADRPIKGLSADDLDMIVLPGGWGGTKALASDATVQNLLKEMDSKGKNIGAICAAPFALNAAGVLKEGYTCYPGIEEEIEVSGFQGDKHAVVESANVMTSRGPGTAICFGLAIVKKLVGKASYEKVRDGLLAGYCETL
ncbi:DJ-1 family glyoxalase III [Sulfuricurvum sp.]|uniref:DJ-1 family glyoxalase III n=1 Tax=Sulfuricurvum sp. TaxID=2025608 RepID=UPI0026387F6E|nr:DJ-1 family glyoxalase III [Sulfuricurvum sp.]MDD2266981.1 DJ-1/PfpI family protein [Sulfuricurvum sp.]MDD2784076.1 DJ-1/PfpI family protein [Sulfuricurvum sp.]